MARYLAYSRVGLRASIVALCLVLACTQSVAAAFPQICHVDPRATAFLHLELSQQGKSAMLPGGCASLAHERVCLPQVTVDGRRLSGLAVLAGDVREATANPARPLRLQSTRAIRAGVAGAIFNRLVALTAQKERIRVSTEAARAFAENELRLYRPSPRVCGAASPIPPGVTPRQYFLSPRTIEAFRQGMITGQERDRILRHYPRLPVNLAFRRWLRSQIPKHTILINGSRPTYSIVDAYPA